MSNICPVYYIIFHCVSVLFKVSKEHVSENQEGWNPSPISATNKLPDLEKTLQLPGPQFRIPKIMGVEWEYLHSP